MKKKFIKKTLKPLFKVWKSSWKTFQKNPSLYLLAIFLFLITSIGLGFFYWHLKNLDFFPFFKLLKGESNLGINQKTEILYFEFWAFILGVIFLKIYWFLGHKQKNFSSNFLRLGKWSFICFLVTIFCSVFIKTNPEKYLFEHLNQLLFSGNLAFIFSVMSHSFSQKNVFSSFFKKQGNQLFIILFCFFVVWYLTVGVVKFLHVNHGGLDYTFFTQGIWHYSRFEEPIITYGGVTKNLHAEHAHFFVALLAPIWMIFNTPFTLLFVDIFAMLSMAIPVFGIAKDKFKSNFLNLVLVFTTLYYFGIQRALEHEFHEANLIAPLFLWTFYALYKEKMRWFVLGIFVLLISKESSAIWVIFLGLYSIFFQKKIKAGLLSIIAALIYFPLVIGWIIPDILGNGTYQHFSFKELGNSPLEVLKTIFTNPIYTFYLIFNPSSEYLKTLGNDPILLESIGNMKKNTLSHMFASFGFLSLFSPKTLFLGLPMIGERFLNSDNWRWSIYLYYNISYLPILALGTIFGITNILKIKIVQKIKKRTVFVFLGIFIFSMSVLVNPKKNPMLLDIFHENFWTFSPAEKTIWELTKIIPQKATLQTQSTILPFFAQRDYIKAFPRGQHEIGKQDLGHNFWNYDRHQAAKKSDETFKNLMNFYYEEPEYTILNPDFVAYPLPTKEAVEAWIVKLRKTHDVVYEKFGTVVFKKR